VLADQRLDAGRPRHVDVHLVHVRDHLHLLGHVPRLEIGGDDGQRLMSAIEDQREDLEAVRRHPRQIGQRLSIDLGPPQLLRADEAGPVHGGQETQELGLAHDAARDHGVLHALTAASAVQFHAFMLGGADLPVRQQTVEDAHSEQRAIEIAHVRAPDFGRITRP